MMRRLAIYLGAGLLDGGIGIGSALALAGLLPGIDPLGFGDVDVGGWRSDFAIGSAAADPDTRVRVARHGLLALAQSEAVYFTRTRDAAGEPLREACRYRLSGGAMPAGWWSVTLYDAASMLPRNRDEALSIDGRAAGRLLLRPNARLTRSTGFRAGAGALLISPRAVSNHSGSYPHDLK